jgi:hypothetical protein
LLFRTKIKRVFWGVYYFRFTLMMSGKIGLRLEPEPPFFCLMRWKRRKSRWFFFFSCLTPHASHLWFETVFFLPHGP